MSVEQPNTNSLITAEQIIEMIDHFQLSTQFFYWLAQEDVNNHILLEKVHEKI